MQKARKLGEKSRSIPPIQEVLELHQEQGQVAFDLGPLAIPQCEEGNEEFVHAHVASIDTATDVWGKGDPSIVDLVNELLKIGPVANF